MRVQLLNADCREAMRGLAEASVDAVVTDPPYELGFMGKGWDASGIAYDVGMWREVWRVLKPGGHLLAFGGTRTYHRMACAIEDAGFEIRDSLHWIYGSGFPKSLDVSKAIDKAAGAEREVVGVNESAVARQNKRPTNITQCTKSAPESVGIITAPATDAARQWSGWGTALKPAHEPIVVARKPLIGTVAANVLAHGTGALNIDKCRVVRGVDDASGWSKTGSRESENRAMSGKNYSRPAKPDASGRWPPNILLSHMPECNETCAEDCAVAEVDRQSGGASRFFPVFRYQAKASRSERGESNVHPTVKPVALMAWLVRLVTPPGGTVLDPFMGSGTTGVATVREGFSFVGVERESEYFRICEARINATEPKVTEQQELFA